MRRIPGPRGPKGTAGPPVVPYTNLYVDKAAPAGGNGSPIAPFKNFADAIVAAGPLATIFVAQTPAPGYLGEGTQHWVDKRLTIVGTSITETASHEVQLPTLSPETTGNPLELELIGVSASVDPVSAAIVSCSNCAIDAQGASGSSYVCEGMPSSMLFSNSTGGLAVAQLIAQGTTLGISRAGSMTLRGCVVLGALTIGGAGDTCLLTNTELNSESITFLSGGATLTTDVASLKTAGTIVGTPTIVLSDQNAFSSQVVIYWEFHTTVPSSKQNGSADFPFADLQTAVDAAGPSGGTVICVGPGDVTSAFSFDGLGSNHTLNIQAYPEQDPNLRPQIGNVTLDDHCHVTFQNIFISGTLTAGAGSSTRVWAFNCTIGSAQITGSTFRCYALEAGSGGNNSLPCSIGNSHFTAGTILDTALFFGMYISGNIVLDGVATDGTCFQQCILQGALSLFTLTTGTIVYIDGYSIASARRLGYDVTTHLAAGATLVLSDRPQAHGLTFTVGALAAAMADVTVALVGCRPGDTFAVAMSTRLAGVGIVGAWCAVADVLTVRFFGTTAGGDVVCDVNVFANSGA